MKRSRSIRSGNHVHDDDIDSNYTSDAESDATDVNKYRGDSSSDNNDDDNNEMQSIETSAESNIESNYSDNDDEDGDEEEEEDEDSGIENNDAYYKPSNDDNDGDMPAKKQKAHANQSSSSDVDNRYIEESEGASLSSQDATESSSEENKTKNSNEEGDTESDDASQVQSAAEESRDGKKKKGKKLKRCDFCDKVFRDPKCHKRHVVQSVCKRKTLKQLLKEAAVHKFAEDKINDLQQFIKRIELPDDTPPFQPSSAASQIETTTATQNSSSSGNNNIKLAASVPISAESQLIVEEANYILRMLTTRIEPWGHCEACGMAFNTKHGYKGHIKRKVCTNPKRSRTLHPKLRPRKKRKWQKRKKKESTFVKDDFLRVKLDNGKSFYIPNYFKETHMKKHADS